MSELSVIDRGIRRCFTEHEGLRNIVGRELLDAENVEKCDGKVEKLAWITIKSIMKRRMMDADEEDVYHQFIYKLIFREPLACYKEMLSVTRNFWNHRQQQHPAEEDIRKSKIQRVRTDGRLMFAYLSQTVPFGNVGTQIHVTLRRRDVWIRVGGGYVAEIPNREGVDFDTYWAEKFAKMAFRKHASSILLLMDWEEGMEFEWMCDYIQRELIDRLPRVVPSEPWEQVISKERPVYMIVRGVGHHDKHLGHQFLFSTEYFQFDDMDYWGYLE